MYKYVQCAKYMCKVYVQCICTMCICVYIFRTNQSMIVNFKKRTYKRFFRYKLSLKTFKNSDVFAKSKITLFILCEDYFIPFF